MEHKYENGNGNGDGLNPLLREALHRLPVPPPRLGFAARVFAALPREARRTTTPLTWALAASLVVAIGGLVISEGPKPAPEPAAAPPAQAEIVMLHAGQVSPLRLSFRSREELSGVTIHLQLPPGVELKGHPGRQALRWQTDFQAGSNMLELPLILRDGEGGILTATLDHGRSQKAFTVQVRANRPTTLFPDATQSAVTGHDST